MQLYQLLDQGITVLTASRRLAHALRLGYAHHARQNGLSVWRTPRVLPWSTWLGQQWLEARADRSDERCQRLLSPAQTRVLWGSIVSSSEWGETLLNPAAAARLAARSWRRMQEYLIPLEPLALSESTEARALHAWCKEFMRRCESLSGMDEARLARWAHESGFVPQETIALAGFDALPPAIAQLVERWRAQRKVAAVEQQERAVAQTAVVMARDAQDELELAARWARGQIEAGRDSVAVIVSDLQPRRAEVQRVFEDVFAPGLRSTLAQAARIPVVIAAPQPLVEYPIVDAALLVLQFALPECPATHAGRLLRSMFIADATIELDRRSMADLRLREEQRDRWDWFELERWAGVTGCERLQLTARQVGDLIRGTDQIRGHGTNANASRWAERFHSWLRAAGWPGERPLSSVEHQTVLKFQAALAEFGTLDAFMPALPAAAALARLQELLRDTAFEPETQSTSITVIDPTTAAGMAFDGLWVAGLDASRLPEPINPDPLLPIELQRAAGVPEATAEGSMRQAQVRLHRWLRCAPEVVLSWPRHADEAELQPSPLLPQPSSDRAEVVTSAVRPLRSTLFEQRPTLEEIRDDRAPRLAASAARGGAMTLELQSRCPFRAQAQLRLGAQPLPRISIGVQPLDRGILLHRVLAEIWGTLLSQRALLALDDETLSQRIRSSAERHVAQALRTTVRYRARLASLEVESLTRQVLQLLQLDRQRPPFTVRFAEAAEAYEIGSLSVTLQPDRIDELVDGGELLIDYKLGQSHQPRQWLDALPGRPRRPQLPLYGLAHSARLQGLAFAVLSTGAVEYRGWSSGASLAPGIAAYPTGLRLKPEDPPDWHALLVHWRTTLTQLAGHFVGGHAAVDPLPFECDTCHLAAFCRIGEHKRNEEAADEQQP